MSTTNTIDQTGIQIQAASDIINELLNGVTGYAGMLAIYGDDINADPNSPDGQMLAIIAQAKLDVLELSVQVYNSFNPTTAIGTSLDQICAINGVIREAGTYTQTEVTVTATQALTLPGLDIYPSAPFTVSDSTGNQYQLLTTQAFSGAASTALLFQASSLGAITPLVNTLTIIVTATLGISAVINPSSASTIGTNEESDASLRVRQANSVALPSKGYLQGLYGALLDVGGVSQAVVLENTTGTTSGGIPGHSIWGIVQGGAAADIAQAIYVKRNAGCGMTGSQTVNVTQVSGGTIAIEFDYATAETLYVALTIAAVTGTYDPTYLAAQIRANFDTYAIGGTATASAITAFVQSLYPNCYTSGEGVSTDGSTYTAHVAPTGVNYVFQILATFGGVKINGTSY